MISTKVKYGLQALLYLSQHKSNGNILSADIAEARQLPKRFLDAILLELRNKGILISKKGRGGGYVLNRTEASIMVGEVIRILDGVPEPLNCTHITPAQAREQTLCRICQIEQQIRDSTWEILDNTSLLDLAANPDAAFELNYDI